MAETRVSFPAPRFLKKGKDVWSHPNADVWGNDLTHFQLAYVDSSVLLDEPKAYYNEVSKDVAAAAYQKMKDEMEAAYAVMQQKKKDEEAEKAAISLAKQQAALQQYMQKVQDESLWQQAKISNIGIASTQQAAQGYGQAVTKWVGGNTGDNTAGGIIPGGGTGDHIGSGIGGGWSDNSSGSGGSTGGFPLIPPPPPQAPYWAGMGGQQAPVTPIQAAPPPPAPAPPPPAIPDPVEPKKRVMIKE